MLFHKINEKNLNSEIEKMLLMNKGWSIVVVDAVVVVVTVT